MNVAASPRNFAESGLWHSLSCNWMWAVVLFICCLLMSINAVSSITAQHECPMIQTSPLAAPHILVKPQTQREQKPVHPQKQMPKAPGGIKLDLDGVT